MLKSTTFLLTLLLCLSSEKLLAKPITFLNTGYSINVLDSGPAQSGVQTALQMFLPARDGFASNVNVQHQAFRGSLYEYAELSKEGVEQRGWTLLREQSGLNFYMAEGVGAFGQDSLELHFYFRAVQSANNIILATATAPQSRWEEEKHQLIPIVDSLQATDNKETRIDVNSKTGDTFDILLTE